MALGGLKEYLQKTDHNIAKACQDGWQQQTPAQQTFNEADLTFLQKIFESCRVSVVQINTFNTFKGKLTTFMSFFRIGPVVDLNSDDHENVTDCRYNAPVGGIREGVKKWPLYCPQGSSTLRQQLLMMHGIA